jgi:large conductance mechanosensitive channel
MFKEFREFVMRGNVMDLAIGIIIGAAFSGVVQSLVNDILMPPIGLLLGGVDFTNLFLALDGNTYASLAEAQAVGAPTLNYGIFINTLINFLIVAFAVFMIVRWVNRLRKPAQAADPTTHPCPYCTLEIPIKATRCPECTADLRSPLPAAL